MSNDTPTIHTVSVPLRFFNDHVDRDLMIDAFTYTHRSVGKARVEVVLTTADLEELLSDADYYDSFTGWDRSDNRALCNSARLTVETIRSYMFSVGMVAS